MRTRKIYFIDTNNNRPKISTAINSIKLASKDAKVHEISNY